MKKHFGGLSAVIIALATVAFTVKKDPAPCESGKKWFFYKITAPKFPGFATLTDIRTPSNYKVSTESEFASCDGTEFLCAICAIPTDATVNALPIITPTTGNEIYLQLAAYFNSNGVPPTSPLRIIECDDCR